MSEDKRPVIICLCHDITLERSREQYMRAAAEYIPGAIAIFKFSEDRSFVMESLSKGFKSMTGYDHQEYLTLFKKKKLYGVPVEEQEEVRQKTLSAMANKGILNVTCRFECKNGKMIWLNNRADFRNIDENEGVFYCVLQDITESVERKRELLITNKKYRTLLESVPGGMVVYELKNQKLNLVYLNSAAAEFTGYTTDEIFEIAKNEPSLFVCAEDRNEFYGRINCLINNGHAEPIVCCANVKHGNKWVKMNSSITDNRDDVRYIYVIFLDITEQIVSQQALKESEARYRISLETSGLSVWEYDVQSHRFINATTETQPYLKEGDDLNDLICKIPFGKDSVETIRKMTNNIMSGSSVEHGEVWIKRFESDAYSCLQLCCTAITDRYGRLIRIYGTSRDITAERNIETDYQNEAAFRHSFEGSTLLSMKVNLTNNKLLGGATRFKPIDEIITVDRLDLFIDKVAERMCNENLKTDLVQKFNHKRLVDSFKQGQSSVSFQCMFRDTATNNIVFIKLEMFMVRDIYCDDVMGYLYAFDITEKTMFNDISRLIANQQYLSVSWIDVATHKLNILVGDNRVGIGEECKNTYDSMLSCFAGEFLDPDKSEDYIKENKIETIVENLKTNDVYEVIYYVTLPSKRKCHIMLKYFYPDGNKEIIVQTSADVTDILRDEKERSDSIYKALMEAERANAAKSMFFAKMSHEMRTPLNAILGSATIINQNSTNNKLVSDLSKSSVGASKYLLALMNDILDIAKIENGNVILKKEHFDCAEVIGNVSGIILPMADIAGIKYVFEKKNNFSQSYYGDPIRLQQILINLLSNSVKFTPEGGTVKLSAQEISSENGLAHMYFVVSDNGIGISNTFLPDMFKPFSQQYEGNTTPYQGTGLGLAIAKNLAVAMGGDIVVKSEVGIGSEFAVDIYLEVQNSEYISEKNEDEKKYDFSGRKVLLVEDNPLNTKIEKMLLKSKGFEVDCAENGRKGIEKLIIAGDKYYDAVLMDIRMPIMDGLEAAKNIRAMEGEYYKSIPIIATTANAYKEDIDKAKSVGMNAHLAKPIDPSKLYDELSRLIDEK